MKKNILLLIVFLPALTFGQMEIDWVTRLGSAHPNDGFNVGRQIVNDEKGNIYVAGEFMDSISIGETKLVANGENREFFVAKLNPNGKVLWLKNIGQPEALCYYSGICTDANSDIYVSGNFKGEITIGDSIYNSNSGWDSFLLKLNNYGQLIWYRAFTGDGEVTTKYVTSDIDGSVYIVGYYGKNLSFDNYHLEAPTARSYSFVTKFNSNGNVIWAKSTSGSTSNFGRYLKSDNKGHLYLTGFMQDSVYFDNQLLVSTGYPQAFISKMDANTGEFLWAKGAGGASGSQGKALAIDSEDNIILTGWYRTELYFDNNSVSNGGDNNWPTDIFVAKFNNDGSLMWLKTTKSSSDSDINDVTTNEKDEIFLTGSYRGNLVFEDSVYHSKSVSFSDILLLKYSKEGKFGWLKSYGADMRPRFYDEGFGITSFNNTIFITGLYSGDIWFDDYFLKCNGDTDVFIAKLFNSTTEDKESKIIAVYPNPCTDRINVKFKDPESIEYRLKLFNLLSNVIYSNNILDTDNINIDLKNCPSGMYILQFLNLENLDIINKKIVKID